MFEVPSQSLFAGMDMYVVYLTLSSLFALHPLAPASSVIAFSCFDLSPGVQWSLTHLKIISIHLRQTIVFGKTAEVFSLVDPCSL